MSVGVDMSPGAIWGRLQEVGRLSGDLRPEHRLDTKIDLSGEGVARRLREVSELLLLCEKLGQAGRDAG